MPSHTTQEKLEAAGMEIGFSDKTILTVSVVGFAILSCMVYFVVLSHLKGAQELKDEDDEGNTSYEQRLANEDVANLTRAQRRARAKHIMKEQRKARDVTVAEEHDDEWAIDHFRQLRQNEQDDRPGLSRKDRQKAAKKTEAKERKACEAERQILQQAELDKAHRHRQERERQQHLKTEEDRRSRQEKHLLEEANDHKKWQTFLLTSDESKSITVTAWVEELRLQPTVHIDTLARRFDCDRADVGSRIKELQKELRVTGVLEPDGRFVFVSRQQLSELATVMKNRDRTTLSHLQSHLQQHLHAP